LILESPNYLLQARDLTLSLLLVTLLIRTSLTPQQVFTEVKQSLMTFSISEGPYFLKRMNKYSKCTMVKVQLLLDRTLLDLIINMEDASPLVDTP
jgi:hypothetical protein